MKLEKKIQFKIHVIKICDSGIQKKIVRVCRLKPVLLYTLLV